MKNGARSRYRPGRAQGDGRGHHAERADDGGEDETAQGQETEVGGFGATATDAAVDGVGDDEHAGREDPGPQGGGCGPGEGHRVGPDLQGHDVGGEAEEQRDDHQQDEADVAAGEERGGGVGGEEVAVADLVDAPERGDDPADDAEHQGEGHVEEADGLVVTGAEEVHRLARTDRGEGLAHRPGLGSRLGYRHVSWDLVQRPRSSRQGPGRTRVLGRRRKRHAHELRLYTRPWDRSKTGVKGMLTARIAPARRAPWRRRGGSGR